MEMRNGCGSALKMDDSTDVIDLTLAESSEDEVAYLSTSEVSVSSGGFSDFDEELEHEMRYAGVGFCKALQLDR
jgi:hypothetical protein